MAIDVRNLDALTATVERLNRAGRDTTRLARDIGAALQRQTITRSLREGGQTLTDTGRLRGSILFEASRAEAAVYTNLEYAPFHQTGAGRLPQRSFIGLGARDESEILGLAARYLEQAAR